MISAARPHPAQLIDVMDARNQPLGYSTDIGRATRRGLWFRAVHVVVYTNDGQVLVERRSHRIMFYPDHLDISLGGIVDAGETPEHAAVRELHEELGLTVKPAQLELISVNNYNRRWPTMRKTTRNITYHYLLKLAAARTPLALQTSEVADARWLTLTEAQALVRHHQVPGFGHLEAKYAMYGHLLQQVSQRLS